MNITTEKETNTYKNESDLNSVKVANKTDEKAVSESAVVSSYVGDTK